jgi:hypothetical protein
MNAEELKFEDLEFESLNNGMNQCHVALPHGYSVSVIIGPFSYGGPKGLYEVGFKGPNGRLIYVDEYGDQVKGYLTKDEVIEEIKFLATKAIPQLKG